MIQFRSDPLPGTQQEERSGILCQDLIRIMIDRVNYLNAQDPSHENITILRNLRECLVVFESRALRRKLSKLPYPERVPSSIDGHVFSLNRRQDVDR